VTKLEVNAPKMPVVSCPSPHCELHATLSKTEAMRGSPITANVDGKVETPAGAYSFHLVVESFVRDAVGRSAIYGAR
jgi:Na+-transporting NADH:ubiquinone oxidoreductase subunit NqrD